jgi:hypothetical protein
LLFNVRRMVVALNYVVIDCCLMSAVWW